MTQLVANVAHAREHDVADAIDGVIDVRANLHLRANHDLRCRRRRRRAKVGDEIGDRRVGLMSDAGDRRDRAVRHGAGDDFFVERPQIFERSSAATDQDDVVHLPARQMTNGCGDFARRRRSLHAHGINLHGQTVVAAPQDVEDVANGRA